MASEVFVGRTRSVVLLVVFSIITLNLYYFYWLYKVNAELRGFLHEGVRPVGRLVIFVLVPVLGWFLAAWFTARSVQAAQIRAGDSRPVSPIYPALFAGLAPIVGWYVAAGFIQGGANRAWGQAAAVLEATKGAPSSLECPDCSTRFRAVLNALVPRDIECPKCHRSGTV